MCYKTIYMDFTGPAAIFVSSFIIALSGALMPGPLLAVTIRHTTRRGFIAAPMLVLGHAILEIILLGLLIFGLIEWFKGDLPIAVVSIAGSLMLLWMAAGMAMEARTIRFREEEENAANFAASSGNLRMVADGIIVSASNPYWILWWATIGLGYLLLAQTLGAVGVLLFFIGHILADVAWYFFVGWAVSAGRGWFTDRAYRLVICACAAFLAFCACSFGYMGITRLVRII
ncbi:MAG: LysE family translocator [Syntrophorhabdaceae bacterium]|nr:LysE family translocator [Syntrophorhabdaceae bacterium]